MYRFLLGLGTGLWLGTYYDCKPMIEQVKKEIVKHIPKEK
jgi:hypothetical protein|tara:strand:+ start:806 stop:925 length:120 start_codon:yes stop_codon:yes gene_type:complete